MVYRGKLPFSNYKFTGKIHRVIFVMCYFYIVAGVLDRVNYKGSIWNYTILFEKLQLWSVSTQWHAIRHLKVGRNFYFVFTILFLFLLTPLNHHQHIWCLLHAHEISFCSESKAYTLDIIQQDDVHRNLLTRATPIYFGSISLRNLVVKPPSCDFRLHSFPQFRRYNRNCMQCRMVGSDLFTWKITL